MLVCMHAWMHGWIDGWMHGWMDGWMDVCVCIKTIPAHPGGLGFAALEMGISRACGLCGCHMNLIESFPHGKILKSKCAFES